MITKRIFRLVFLLPFYILYVCVCAHLLAVDEKWNIGHNHLSQWGDISMFVFEMVLLEKEDTDRSHSFHLRYGESSRDENKT